jgi:DNA repair protein RadD
MDLRASTDKKGQKRLEVCYFDADAQVLKEFFYINSKEDASGFYFNFVRMHNKLPENKLSILSVEDAMSFKSQFRQPLFVIARKQKIFWNIKEKIFE